MDTQRIRTLLDQRDAIDQELREAIGGEAKEKKTVNCGICGQPGHNSKSCPKKPPEKPVSMATVPLKPDDKKPTLQK